MKLYTILFFLSGTNFVVCTTSSENILQVDENHENSFFSGGFFPLSPIHQIITNSMQLYGFLLHTPAEFSYEYESLFEKKAYALQNAVEELLLGNTYFIQQDDIVYVSQLLKRIIVAGESSAKTNEKIESFLAVMREVQNTVDQLIQ